MRVLLLNPQDGPFDGPWASESWGLVVDLGWAGSCSYAEWSQRLRCPVFGLFSLGEEIKDVQRVAEELRNGHGYLVDSESIDWWDLMAPARYIELHEQLLLGRLTKKIPPHTEVRASRPHRLVKVLEALRNSPICSYLSESSSGFIDRFRRAGRLRPRQMLGVALDKWDADLGLRRFVATRPKSSRNASRVLLPSSYVNVSRVLCAYASSLPERQFLLVTTRANGQLTTCPPNVQTTSLASYAPLPRPSVTEKEITQLQDKWQLLKNELLASEKWRPVVQRGCYEEFPRWLSRGIRVRDAWREVIAREAIEAVFCGDENNYFNRLPVLLAKNRKIATVSCSHGALDMNLILRGVAADVYVARGEMEKDYIVRTCCTISPGRVVVAAPRSFSSTEKIPQGKRDQVVLFSEEYELYSGRTDVFYGEVLPRLAAIARSQQKKAIVKLHPFENLAERTKLVDRILPADSRAFVELTNKPLTDSFLDRTWFALTVESSVAVECALRGVPCFLCSWHELGLYGYGRQFEKYGAARTLQSPDQIREIPTLLGNEESLGVVPEGLISPADPSRLNQLFRGMRDPQPAPVGP